MLMHKVSGMEMLLSSRMRGKMEIRYKTDLYASYMQVNIPLQIDRKQYAFQMLEENSIRGILPARERLEEGKAYFYLDITGKISLQQEYKDREMELEDMTTILNQVVSLLEELRNYLLPDKFVLAEPEFLYWDTENNSLWAALLPWERTEHQGLRKLAEFFLEKMSPRDENGINAAYLFYKQQSQTNFSLYQFLPIIERENILKRQKKKDMERYQPEDSPSILDVEALKQEDGKGYKADEEIPSIGFSRKKKTEKKKKRRFFFGLFSRKEKTASAFDLRINEDEKKDFSEELWEYPETIFFESEAEEWRLQWKERGKLRSAVLKDMPVTVGKIRGEVSVVMEDSSVSRIHCRFIEYNGEIAIMDMNSTNGTSLNGMKLRPGEIMGIAKNDEILIGKVRALVV